VLGVVYDWLGLSIVDDALFRDLVIAWLVEPTSGADAARVRTTISEHAKMRRLKREVADLRRANEILKSASAFFAAELDRPATK
jgi:transposase-like protein